MKTTFTHMMIIGMMIMSSTTGFAKTTVTNHNNPRNEVRKEVRHEMDRRHETHHDKAPHMMPARPVERMVTVVESRGIHERAKRCSVCKHNLRKGERHTHVVRIMR